ncbi:hypothetical protein ebA5034 [Aromatoleum aromaticum EbN1]|uniref:Uncharacterized protein n=1 Tax=Aromatoleum aromaticum (strain DSM 19018 / LMG 30748 / EbN1) TaxID=76114 RepID=Q5P129_AROAE|nr:hypothetical protein ebA5034 [Aromatoleum aromaticum EbN1]
MIRQPRTAEKPVKDFYYIGTSHKEFEHGPALEHRAADIADRWYPDPDHAAAAQLHRRDLPDRHRPDRALRSALNRVASCETSGSDWGIASGDERRRLNLLAAAYSAARETVTQEEVGKAPASYNENSEE